MDTFDSPRWLGTLSTTVPTAQRGGIAPPARGKRNLWVVVGFFGLVVATLINSLV